MKRTLSYLMFFGLLAIAHGAYAQSTAQQIILGSLSTDPALCKGKVNPCFQPYSSTNKLPTTGGGGGGGTVNTGTAGQAAFYATTGTAVSGTPLVTIGTNAVTIGTSTSTLTFAPLGTGLVGITSGVASTTSTVTVSGDVSIGSTGIATVTGIQGTAVSTPTGTGAVVLQASPNFTGNVGIGTSSNVANAPLDVFGHIHPGGTAPTVTSCGGGTLSAGSSDNRGVITGVSAATACTVTFANSFNVAPACAVSTSTGIAAGGTATASALTASFAIFSGTLSYLCF